MLVRSPLELTERLGSYDVVATVHGGGFTGQAGAVRHGIARALIKNAPVMILDDSVSAVDTKTERIILENLKKREGRTTLLIAHRISTVEEMDKIIFMDEGEVKAVGTHRELYASCEAYRKMVDLQKLEEEEREGETNA